MPQYNANPPVFYNSGLRYRSAAAPTTSLHKMSKIARNWSKLPIKQRSAFFKKIVEGLTDNPTVVATPKPTLAELNAAQAKSEASISKVDDLEQQLVVARTEMHDDIDAESRLIDLEIPTVESATGGDKAKIQTIGYDVVDDSPANPRDVAKLERVSVTSGDGDGELDITHDRDPAARSNEAETTATPNDATSWKKHTAYVKSSTTLTGLPSGTRIYVRVRGIGPKGPGPWSEIASKIVP